ncbi:MAG TPA: hypothetical protein VK024_00600 [Actinomycetaceae bacterium]|nr:hypothetical protein [Actinomycetaceae bacterium]
MSHLDRVLHLLPPARHRRAGDPFILGIDGRSGAEKSRLAAAVARRRPDARIVALEDAYPGWWQLHLGVARVASGVLAPLVRGEAGHFQRYDWHRGQLAEQVTVAPAPVIILEGCGATSAACRPYLDASVWLAVAEPTRRARAMARDDFFWRELWHQWSAQEAALQRERSAIAHATLVLREGS